MGPTYEGCDPRSELHTWAERIREWVEQNRMVFVYFNNDPHGFAIEKAQTLKELLGVKEYEGMR